MNRKSIASILFLLVVPLALASETVEDPVSCEGTQWYKPHTWFPCLSDKAIQYTTVKVYSPAFLLETLLTRLSIVSFDFETIAPYWLRLNYLAGILLVIVIAYTGYLFMLSSFDIKKRAMAKKQVWNTFLIILLSNLSLAIALLILEFANLITRYFWTTMLQEQIAERSIIAIIFSAQPVLAFFYLVVFLIFGLPLIVRMIARIILLIAFLAALPLIITFNFFLPSEHYGHKFITLFLINVFFPIIWILVFIFGKIITAITVQNSLLGIDLAQIIVFAGCLYLNSYLYKKLAFNLSVKDAVAKTVGAGVKIWKAAKIAGAAVGV